MQWWLVPRNAKSAATLICLGAKEIHMGVMSQLGPIDPQINGRPILGISSALEKITKLNNDYPKTSDMFAKFLSTEINLINIGYFDRLTESAVQYAERLLKGGACPTEEDATTLAKHFVEHYKDHGFVIDVDKSQKHLGTDMILEQTEEYEFANEVYEKINLWNTLLRIFQSKKISVVGDIKIGSIDISKIER